jgi:hypothetical protein
VGVSEGEISGAIIRVADDSGEGVDVCTPPGILFSPSGIFVSVLTMISGVGETMAI